MKKRQDLGIFLCSPFHGQNEVGQMIGPDADRIHVIPTPLYRKYG